MKIIISPAKAMNIDRESYAVKGLPPFLGEAKILMKKIQTLTFYEAKHLWQCNDKLAELNFQRFSEMEPEKDLTPAILSYDGLQYKNMGPGVFSDGALEYIGEHLRILSGFYGILRPFDGVTPYRLEMQAKLAVGTSRNLYEFWGGKLYAFLENEYNEKLYREKPAAGNSGGKMPSFTILNLASKEYSQAVEKHIGKNCRLVTAEFCESAGGKLRQKATLAKMARGDMVRFLAENDITDIGDVRKYNGFGFSFSREFSGENKLVFVK